MLKLNGGRKGGDVSEIEPQQQYLKYSERPSSTALLLLVNTDLRSGVTRRKVQHISSGAQNLAVIHFYLPTNYS